ncbi:MAG: hypothetical protein GX154_10660 [Clostridiales bacterium]|nr:hypothetical protein [Clostridiales bacterium]
MLSYAVVDVETPNKRNDAVCSIAIVHMANGKPVHKIYKLVNPETYFDDFNIKLHGITPAMVKNQPNFNDVWDEIQKISKWLKKNKHLCGQFPYNDLLDTCEEILADGFISEEERDYLMLLLNEFISPSAIIDEHQDSQKLNISGKRFCLSGNFSAGTKDSIENAIASLGGECAKSVTRETDILLIGGEGNENWLYGNYGSKVAKALQMQEKGHHIQILNEAIFADIFKEA